MRGMTRGAGVMLVVLALAGGAAEGADLPAGFVHLADVAPGIQQDMRYASADNFTGRRVPGYETGTCILARPVAEALKRVQDRLAAEGFGLKVFDCYRPVRSVKAFMAWADGRAGDGLPQYFPRVQRDKIIPLGYVARQSSHSRGTAVDLTLVRRSAEAALQGGREGEATAAGPRGRVTCLEAARFNRRADELDMGTAFDCFDAASHTHTRSVGAEQRANRRRLLNAMTREGFRNYKREWWHFSLPLKGFGQARDFPVR